MVLAENDQASPIKDAVERSRMTGKTGKCVFQRHMNLLSVFKAILMLEAAR